MDQQRYLKIINGNFQNIPKNKSNQVRVFLSSTFTDTHAERDYLIANTYPKLKKYCKEKYGMDFQVYDMRWGISHEATNQHDTTEICLTEIRNCQKFSFGPNFITILSHKYGSRFLPARIVKDEYEILRKTLGEHKEIDVRFEKRINDQTEYIFENLFEDCYQLNENETPARYRIKSLKKLFNSKENTTEQSVDDLYKIWIKIELKLGNILRTLADLCFKRGVFNRNQYERYYVSVTEKEVYNGILNVKNAADNALYFEREIEDIEENINFNPSLAKRFIDLDDDNKIDSIPKQFLDNLKYNKIPSKLPESNIFKFKVKWDKETGISAKSHSEYIENFANVFYEQCKILVERNYQQKAANFNTLPKPDNNLLQEVLEHANFCNETAEKFHGRNDLLLKIKEYLLSNLNVPMLIHGFSGCGKTAILAKITSQILTIVPDPDNYSIILRFLGTTPQTSNIIQTYNSIIYQIARIFNQKLPNKFFASKVDLKAELEERLFLFSHQYPNKKLVLVLDSIDQLNPVDYDLDWIITLLPPNVKVVYSSIPDHANILTRFKTLFSNIIDCQKDDNTLSITSLDKSISIEILKDWLTKENKSITSEQWNILNKMFDTAVLFPLYIKLIYDFISKWKSFYLPNDDFKTCLNIDKSIVYLFKLLEKNHGELLFSRAIIYMTLFKNGISECEIEDILSLDDDVLYDIFEFHAPPVRKLPICLWSRIKNALQGYMVEKEIDDTRVIYWYHRRFIEVSNSFYISKMNSEKRNAVFSNVIDFFNETWKNTPKPFKYKDYVAKKLNLNSEKAEQIRDTSMQPTIFKDEFGNIKFNKRKICELPEFITQLSANVAIPLSCEHVFFNYYFLNGLFNFLSFKELADLVQRVTQSSSYSLSEESKVALKELNLFSITFLQCSFSLSDYPNSAISQILSKTLQIYGYSKNYKKLVDEYDQNSPFINSLIVPYQYLQSPGDDLIFQLERHNYPITCTAIGGDNDSFVFTISNKLNVISLTSIIDVCNIQLKHGYYKFNFMVVYFHENFSSEDLKTIPGGLIIASENELFSYSFEFLNSSVKFPNEIINNIFIISKTNVLVSFEGKPYIEIRDLLNLTQRTKHEFNKNITSILSNTHHQRINQTPLFDSQECFLVILFESNELVLNKVDDLNLVKLYSINPPGFDIIDYRFNTSDDFYSYKVESLFITYSNGSILSVPINEITKNNEHDVLNVNFDYLWVKFEKYKNVNFRIITINDKMSLFIGSNKNVYIILNFAKSSNMIEIEGNFDNATYITDKRVGCMENGFFTLYGLVYNENDLNKYYVVSLFSIEAHYDKITFSFIKDQEMMLSTSLDSTLKIFLISKLAENESYRIKFDKNEKELIGLMPFDSDFAICKLKNSNYLNIWKISNGKIFTKLDVEKNEIIEECLIDDSLKRLLVLTSSIENNKLSLLGYSYKIKQDKLEFKQEFKNEVIKEKSFKMIKDVSSNRHILLTQSSTDNHLLVNVYETIEKSPNRIKTIKINYTPFETTNVLDKSCLTSKNRYLCIFIESDLFIFDINTTKLITSRSFIEQDMNIDFFLSPTNPSFSQFLKIEPIGKTDDLIALNNLNELIYLNLNQYNKLKLIKNYDYKMVSFKLINNLLFGFDQSVMKLIFYDLNNFVSNASFKKPKFTIELSSPNIIYGFSLNTKYFYTIEDKLLNLYRLNDHKKIGEAFLYTQVTDSICTNDFVCLTMRDNKFISFLIMEPNEKDKISKLESRNGILTDETKKRCEKLIENASNMLDSSSEEEDDDKNLNEFLFGAAPDKENKSYEKYKKMSI